jgi:hypothetical protein
LGITEKKGIKFDMFTLAKALGPAGWAWFGLARLGSAWLGTAQVYYPTQLYTRWREAYPKYE